MKSTWMWTMVVMLGAGAVAYAEAGAAAKISPTSPASLSVVVDAGETVGVNGAKIAYQGATLTFDEPEIRQYTSTGKSPENFASWFTPWEPWPGQAKAIRVGPRHDSKGVPILGGLFKAVQPETVVVTTKDGSKTFKMNVDFKFNADWGQVANIGDRLGKKGEQELKVTASYATQRLDLIQVDADGKLSVKKGAPAIVCPALPEPDAGASALAGVYIAPWRQQGAYVISAQNIFPIKPAAPAAPINPAAVANTLAKLHAGETVTVAIMGDSITLGAEGCRWWDKAVKFTAKDLAYRGRFIYGLRQRFPRATVKVVEAYKGGSTTKFGAEKMDETVLPAKPDLVTIAFGMNDGTSPIGGKPRLAAPEFKEAIRAMVRKARGAGAEVILVTPMQPNPWLKNGLAKRMPAYRKALLEVGAEENVGVADVWADWMNLPSRGIPQYTQLHNWNNHPGAFGHKVYADAIGRFFK